MNAFPIEFLKNFPAIWRHFCTSFFDWECKGKGEFDSTKYFLKYSDFLFHPIFFSLLLRNQITIKNAIPM
jgi:hypothetical protein